MSDSVVSEVQVSETPKPSATSATEKAPTAPSWLDELPEDLKITAAAKGWKTPLDPVKAYQGAAKFLGTDPSNILRLPKGEDDTEGWSRAYDSLGRPKTPQEYELPLPAEAPPEDVATAEWYKDVAHKAGLNAKQAKDLFEAAGVRASEMAKGFAEASEATRQKQSEALRKDWGPDYDRNVMVAKRAFTDVLGGLVTSEQLDALDSSMGHDWTMKFMHRIGTKLGEAPFVSGQGDGPQPAWINADTARQKLAGINEKYREELSGRKPFQHQLKADILQQREELYKIIYGGKE